MIFFIMVLWSIWLWKDSIAFCGSLGALVAISFASFVVTVTVFVSVEVGEQPTKHKKPAAIKSFCMISRKYYPLVLSSNV